MKHDTEVILQFCKLFHPFQITLIGVQIIFEKFKRRIPVKTFKTDDEPGIQRFLKEYHDYCIYFSVNEIDTKRNRKRYEEWCIDEDKKYIKDKERKAEKEDVGIVHWLHIDMDVVQIKNPTYKKSAKSDDKNWFEYIPLTEEQFKDQRDDIQKRISKFKTKPTLIIDSGNGFQCFWRIQPTQIKGDDKERLKVCNLIERRNYQLMTDLMGDSCFNVDRIMRLPGSINFPNASKLKKGRKERSTSFLMNELSYNLEDFKQCDLGIVMAKKSIQKFPEISTIPVPKSFYGMLEMHDSLLERWQGSKKGLDGDNSRSSMDFSLLALLKECEFTAEQTFSILKEFKYGKLNEIKNPKGYFERMWSKAYTTEEWMLIGEIADGEI